MMWYRAACCICAARARLLLYLIREFQKLKDDENDRLKLDWNLQRLQRARTTESLARRPSARKEQGLQPGVE